MRVFKRTALALLLPTCLFAQEAVVSDSSIKTITWPDGTQYVGEIVDDERSGQGSIFWEDGTRFDGRFENDMRNGPGTLILPDGTRYAGIFADDELVTPAETEELVAELEEQLITEVNEEVKQAIIATIDAWASGWSQQDFSQYLDNYSAEFQVPEELTRNDWEDLRERRLSAPSRIDLDLKYVAIELYAPDIIDVYIHQTYASNTFSDFTNKQLRLKREDQSWRIIAEISHEEGAFLARVENAESLLEDGAVVEMVDEIVAEAVNEPVLMEATLVDEELITEVSPDLEETLVETVEAWAEAWSEQEAPQYLDYYSEYFEPADGLSREDWEELRTSRLNGPDYIELDISDPTLAISAPNTVDINFDQIYQSDSYADLTDKSLRLRKEGEVWKIISELSHSSVQVPVEEREAQPVLSTIENAQLPYAVVSEEVQQQIVGTMELWKNAWSEQVVVDYLEQYSNEFQVPSDLTRSTWEALRANRLIEPEYIFLDVINANFEMQTTDIVDVYFRQIYDSNRYSDFTNKRLRFKKENEAWKILIEESLTTTPR